MKDGQQENEPGAARPGERTPELGGLKSDPGLPEPEVPEPDLQRPEPDVQK